METWNFQLRLNRALTDDDVDALFEAGLDDAGIESEPIGIIDLDREAANLMDAISSALTQIESVPGLRVVGLGESSFVTLREIADRFGRSYETVRMYVEGKRGPGGFPSALVDVHGPKEARAYSWAEVADWAADKMRLPVVRPDPLLPAIDHALALRAELGEVAKEKAERIRELITF